MSSMIRSTGSTLPLTVLNGEPRVYDITLGERLGFERPRDIRKIIKRNEAKLLTFGGCATVARVVEGNETAEFYLNQKQSLFICMKSETDRAFDVQVEIIRVFDAYLNGDLKPTVAEPTLVSQPRQYRDLIYAIRVFDLTKDAWGKQAAANTVKILCGHVGVTVPDFALIGKPIEQMQLEV